MVILFWKLNPKYAKKDFLKAAKKLGFKIATPVFDGVKDEELKQMMKDAGVAEDGKTINYVGMQYFVTKAGKTNSQNVYVSIKFNEILHDNICNYISVDGHGALTFKNIFNLHQTNTVLETANKIT